MDEEARLYFCVLERADPKTAAALRVLATRPEQIRDWIAKDKNWNFEASQKREEEIQAENSERIKLELATEEAAKEAEKKAEAANAAKEQKKRARRRSVEPKQRSKPSPSVPMNDPEALRVGECARLRVQATHGVLAGATAAAQASSQAFAGIRRAKRGDGSLRTLSRDSFDVSPEQILGLIQEKSKPWSTLGGEE